MVTRTHARNAASTATRPSREATHSKAGSGADAHARLGMERMSKVDTAWLRMDSASNLMMIVGVWILQPGIQYQALCDRIEERLLKYPRFTQRVVQDGLGATWVTDRQFDIHRHVVTEILAKTPRGPKGSKGQAQAALQARLAELAMTPLDHGHPLWQFHLIEHYQGGSAMLVRIHHCIADGIALIGVTQSLVDGGAAPPGPRAKTPPREGLHGVQDWIAASLPKPFGAFAAKTLGAAGQGVVRSWQAARDPNGGLGHVLGNVLEKGLEEGMANSVDAAKMAFHAASDAAALLLMADDSPTRLKGVPGTSKRVAWCDPLPLDDVKTIGKALGCSINDVLMSCVAGAIGQYLVAHGDTIAGKEIRAMVPVNLRPAEQSHHLGNQFGLAPVVLPIGIENPIERVFEVRRRMGELKGSMQPLLAFGLLAVAGLLVKPAQDAMLAVFSKKTTAVMTNVPGPREKLKLLGATLEQSLFWVPQSGSVGLGVSILSYGGGVQFGVISDASLCPDPQAIIDGFEPEFWKLALLTLMLPWDA